jgi:myo-inositol-1(or 4)-monophosphatase
MYLARNVIVRSADLLGISDESDTHILYEKGRDIKLDEDTLLHREITDRLSSLSGIRCLSEEDVASHMTLKGESYWIVDPLDGSMNFCRGVPLYSVSVALWRDEKPVLGVVYDPARKESYCVCDVMTTVEGHLIQVSQNRNIENAVLATGLPVLTDFSECGLTWLTRFAKRFKKIRMLGTAALSLAWVAAGKLDAYFERDIMIWDVAAGLALVEGAGGAYVMSPGRSPCSFDVLAANHDLLKAMRDELKELL